MATDLGGAVYRRHVASYSASFRATVWVYEGPAGWHFLSLPTEIADEIADRVADRTSAFGSVRVEAEIGATSWTTSLFPDARSGTYLLPLKKAVRAAEDLADGSSVTVHLTVLES